MSNQASNQTESVWPQIEATAIDQSKFGFLFRALWLGSIVAAIMSVIRLQQSLIIGLSDIAFAAIALVMAYFLRRYPHRVNWFSNAAIGLYWVLFLAIFILAPYNKTRFVLFVLLAAAALFLKGRKLGFWWVIAILASVVIAHAVMPDSGYSNLDILTGVIHTLVLLVIFEFHERMVRQQQTQLQKINQQLDEQVHQRTLALQEANQALQQEKEQLRNLSFHDHLTGLYNRQKVEEVFEYEKSQLDRYHETFSLILIDVDHFKKINDHLGHEAGDNTLKEIARILSQYTRVSDLVARWGGDEFVIIATKTDTQRCQSFAEAIRQHIQQAGIKGHVDDPVTICIGYSTVGPDDTLQTILRRADDALYEAKRAGRNCVKSQ